MSDFIQGLYDEQKNLTDKLEKNPDFVRLELIRRLLREYGQTDPASEQVEPTETSSNSQPMQVSEFVRRPSDWENIKDEAFEILKDADEPQPAREIVESLVRRGIHPPGLHAINNLSAHLGKDQRFESWERNGWFLADKAKAARVMLEAYANTFCSSLQEDDREAYKAHKDAGKFGLPAHIDSAMLTNFDCDGRERMYDFEKPFVRRLIERWISDQLAAAES